VINVHIEVIIVPNSTDNLQICKIFKLRPPKVCHLECNSEMWSVRNPTRFYESVLSNITKRT